MCSLKYFCRCLVALINVSLLFEKNILIHGENTDTLKIYDTSWEDENVCPSFLSDTQCSYFKKLLKVIGSESSKRILDHITSDKNDQITGMEQIEELKQDKQQIANKHSRVNQNTVANDEKTSKISSIEEIEKLEQNFIKENKWLPDFQINEKDLVNLTVVSRCGVYISDIKLSLNNLCQLL